MLVTRRRSCGSVGPPSGRRGEGVGRAHVGERRRAVRRRHPPSCTFSVRHCTSGTRRRTGGRPWRPSSETPTLRALLARRDLRLRLDDEDGHRRRRRSTAPVRWVHSSDLADPTPFLSEGLVLLTTGHAVRGRRRRPGCVPRLRPPARGARRGRARLRHRGGARRHPAGPCRRMPRRADAAVRGALPHAVHRRRARQRRGDRGAVVRAAQLGARRAARDRPRRAAPGRARRDPRRARPAARHVGRDVRRRRRARARASGRRTRCRGRREPARRGRRRAAARRARRARRCASATPRSRCRPSAAAGTCAA